MEGISSRLRLAFPFRPQAEPFAAVAAGLYGLAPGAMAEIPAHGGAQPFLEALSWRPAELAPDLRVIDGVAAVVAGTVGDEGLERAVGGDAAGGEGGGAGRRAHALERVADGVDDLQVGPLAASAQVVALARPAAPQHLQPPAAVVFHVDPVADVAAVAVDGQRPAVEGVEDHQGDQLLGELV